MLMNNNLFKQKANNFCIFNFRQITLNLLLLTVTVYTAAASVSNYVFNSSSGNYLPITGNILFFGTWDDSNSALLPLPFFFHYNDNDFTSLSISSNGFITLGALTSTVYCGLQTSGPNSIAAYGTDLMGNPGSTVEYGIRGAAPFQQFIIQWTDCAHYQSTVDHYSFQIILNETTNLIEVVYGPFTAQTTMGDNNCTDALTESGNVGLKGFNATDINIRKITNGINDWNSSLPGNALNEVCNLSSANFPASGLTFSWTPQDMFFNSCSTVFINDSSSVCPTATNNAIARLKITTTGHLNPLFIDSITFSTLGFTNTSVNLSEANIYMTGNSDLFSTATRFGFTFSDPDGIHVVTDHAPLLEGNNYFWLAYDIAAGAGINDTITGCFLTITGNGTIRNRSLSSNCPLGYQVITSPTLNLKVFFESYYAGNNSMLAIVDPINSPTVFDTITVELHHTFYPFNLAYKTKGIISTHGKGQFSYPSSVLSQSFYLAIRCRNSVETWSKNPVLFDSTIINVDFSTP